MSNRTSGFRVQKGSRLLYELLCPAVRVYCALAGVRVSFENRCGKLPEGPSIVLCNHGSFIDFIYAGIFLRKCHPNFVIARLYFYHKWLSRLLRLLGGFPKSMFARDLESTKNCMRVLQEGGVLAMMPEARLSTAGKFEDIQGKTYSFLKKVAVPVYTLHLSGDYLAMPKWGCGLRRGALVEAKLDRLFTGEELRGLSEEEIRQRVERQLDYDEFRWLETKPQLRYRSARLAEGLENILSICPKCGRRHTITTRKREIFCEHCGYLTALDSRYAFDKDFRFDNLSQWYEWQMGVIAEEIEQNAAFSLRSEVELRLPGTDGKSLTRHSGRGVCALSREGLVYSGTRDGEAWEIRFPLQEIYRLLFGAGENFELYNGQEILYFVPDERRSAVDWYMVSKLLCGEKTCV